MDEDDDGVQELDLMEMFAAENQIIFDDTVGAELPVKEGNIRSDWVLRTFLVSATIEKLHKKESFPLEKLVKRIDFRNKIQFIKLASKEILPSKLKVTFYQADSHLKELYLYHIISESVGKSVLVFSNSINSTQKLYSIFHYFDEFNVNSLFSTMSQNQRNKNIERFKRNHRGEKPNVLICSDVAARGLDFPDLDLVIHFHVPKTIEFFVHRSGRTARALNAGETAVLVSRSEHKLLTKIYVALKMKEQQFITVPEHMLEKYKGLMSYVKEEEQGTYKSSKKIKDAKWLQKQAAETGLEIGEDLQKDLRTKEAEEFLNKKRKRNVSNDIGKRNLLHKIRKMNIPKTSFLNPDMVERLLELQKKTDFNKVNLTETLFEASSQKEQLLVRRKKTRHVKRRRGRG